MEEIKNIFELIYSLNKKSPLEEEINIVHKINNEIINDKKLIKKKNTISFFINEIKLEKNESIIIKDIPVNFISFFGIIIGENSKLVSFKRKSNETIFFSDEENLQYFSDIEEKSIKKVNPLILRDKKIENIVENQDISEIKKYLIEVRKLDLNKIHLVNSNKLELFLPTIKREHFRIAKKLKIPLKELINKNFIKVNINSKKIQEINIYDTQEIKNVLNPIKEIKEISKIKTLNNNIIFKDISRELIIKVNIERIKSKIKNIENTNINLDEFQEYLKGKETLLIGTKNKEKYILPIFKNKEIKIFRNRKDFEKNTGVIYKDDKNFLNSVKVQKNSKEDYSFLNYYLNPKLNFLIEKNKITNNLTKSYTTTLLKLILKDLNENLFSDEEINISQVSELIKHIKAVTKFTINKSILFNKIPTTIRAQTITQKYLISKISSLYLNIEDYKKNKSKKKLLRESLKIAQKISEFKKEFKIKEDDLYFYHQCILIYLEVLKIFKEETSTQISELLLSYFKENKIKIFKSKIDKSIETIIEDLILASKLSKNKNIMLQIKESSYNKLISKRITIMPTTSKITKTQYRGNIPNLRKIAPYSYKKILKKINGNSKLEYIKINNKEIKLNNTLIKETNFHNNFKEIKSNKIFSIFKN